MTTPGLSIVFIVLTGATLLLDVTSIEARIWLYEHLTEWRR